MYISVFLVILTYVLFVLLQAPKSRNIYLQMARLYPFPILPEDGSQCMRIDLSKQYMMFHRSITSKTI